VKRVLTAGILIPIVVLALFRAPLWLFALLVLGVALLAAKEYLGIVKASGFRPFRVLSYALVVWLPLVLFEILQTFNVYALLQIYLFALVAPLVLLAFALMVMGLERDSLTQLLPDAAVSYMVLPYVAIPLALMIVQRTNDLGALLLLYLMVIVWSGDIAAYYVGRAVGKHKLAPRVSPGKTWEGTIASGVGSIIVGLLLFHFAVPIEVLLSRLHLWKFYDPAIVARPLYLSYAGPLWLVVPFALCVNIAAQLGDLVESALKRGAGLKDSGSLLPGHGGILDRIDALLFALPVGWLFYQGSHLQNFFRYHIS